MEPGTASFYNEMYWTPDMREYIVLRCQPLYLSKMVSLEFKNQYPYILFHTPLCHNTISFPDEVEEGLV